MTVRSSAVTSEARTAPAIRFGAAYYHEYQPYDRLDCDIALMLEAGINTVRVGESTWSSWEPSSGRFQFTWMRRTLDALHAAGIDAVLGTPTYAIPAWLAREHPELLARRPDGTTVPFGGRQNVNLLDATYRFHAERAIRAIVSEFAPHPGVVGFQVDNETGLELLDNDDVFHAFLDWLKTRYSGVDQLNSDWGLTYWSHRLSRWEDLWRPGGNTNPSYAIEWRRFQSQLVTDFLGWQADLVRGYARSDQFITTCLVGGHNRAASDRRAVASVLDVTSENLYYAMQDALSLPQLGDCARFAPRFVTPGGVWRLSMLADTGRSAQRGPFLVAESNAQAIGDAHENFPPYPGQLRLAAYTMLARGAVGVGYWHWHTCHQGFEQYWGGILGHDLEPGRTYRELGQLGAELARHGPLLASGRPQQQVGVLYSQDTKYAFAEQPPLAAAGSELGDPEAYARIFDTFYRGFFDAGAQMAIVHPDDDFQDTPVLVAPAVYAADEPLLERLADYADRGGHLVLTFRSGYANTLARARWTRAPGPLRSAAGVSYQEFTTLTAPVALRGDADGWQPPHEARATGWADGLVLESAEALCWYDHPEFGRFPAATWQPYGKGSVTYIGTLPNPALASALAERVLHIAGLPELATLPPSVRLFAADLPSGDVLWYLTNWSASSVEIKLPHPSIDVLANQEVAGGECQTIAAWDLLLMRMPATGQVPTRRAVPTSGVH